MRAKKATPAWPGPCECASTAVSLLQDERLAIVDGIEHRTYRVAGFTAPARRARKARARGATLLSPSTDVEWQRRLREAAPVALGTLRPGTLPLPPVTVEERLAQAAQSPRQHRLCMTHHTPQEDRMP